jgi:WD repeat-containing protein 68
LLATTGDYLRLWGVTDSGVKMESMLLNNKHSEYCAPVTSFDWSEADRKKIGTCSVDTTCTIWDLMAEKAVTQLIAHDSEVFDIKFKDQNQFCTVGADGSVRMFDLRSLLHSTIMYETSGTGGAAAPSLLRISWNRMDDNFIAVFAADSDEVVLLDLRAPSIPALTLRTHKAPVNAVSWAPHSSCHICTVADDSQALIWDVRTLPDPVDDPILAYKADGEINNMLWPLKEPEWVVINYGDCTQLLRV